MKETKQKTIQVNRVCLVTIKQPLLSQRNVPNRSSYRKKALKQSKTRMFGECANSLNTKALSLTVRGLKDNIGEHAAICEGVLSKMLRKRRSAVQVMIFCSYLLFTIKKNQHKRHFFQWYANKHVSTFGNKYDSCTSKE